MHKRRDKTETSVRKAGAGGARRQKEKRLSLSPSWQRRTEGSSAVPTTRLAETRIIRECCRVLLIVITITSNKTHLIADERCARSGSNKQRQRGGSQRQARAASQRRTNEQRELGWPQVARIGSFAGPGADPAPRRGRLQRPTGEDRAKTPGRERAQPQAPPITLGRAEV